MTRLSPRVTYTLSPSIAMAVVTGLLALGPVALIWFPEIAGGSAVTRKKTSLGNYDEPRSPLNHAGWDSRTNAPSVRTQF